jgi:glutamate 5-kinase
MQLYEEEFAFYDLLVGQVLLTQADVDDRRRFINARHTLRLLTDALHAIPIVNENDTVANEEIRLGDNDRLASLVASLFDADLLVILSDVGGILTANPKLDPTATVIGEVGAFDAALDALIWTSPTGPGRGGMRTKVEAARTAARAGIPTVIAAGREANVVQRVLAGEVLGTLVIPPADSLPARQLWLLHGVQPAGRIVVDDGACQALTQRGKSLLARGVVAVEGKFPEGSAVAIVDRNGVAGAGWPALLRTSPAPPARAANESVLGFELRRCRIATIPPVAPGPRNAGSSALRLSASLVTCLDGAAGARIPTCRLLTRSLGRVLVGWLSCVSPSGGGA